MEEMPASSRRYPWVAFSPDREVGKDILFVTDVSKTVDGVKVLDKVSFIGEPRGQNRLCGRQRERPDRPVQDPHRRDGARRGHRQVGPDRHLRPTSPRTTPRSSRTATTTWWSGCASSPRTSTRPISGASWAGCSSPATTCTSR